jgi:hypothetical protein
LSYQIVDPIDTNKKIYVCLKCYHQKNKAPPKSKPQELDLLKIDEKDQQLLPPPVSDVLLHPIPVSNSDDNLDNKDDEMLRRLAALKAREPSAEDNNEQSIEHPFFITRQLVF